jgi:RNA polymerase-binding transcription factor DksA
MPKSQPKKAVSKKPKASPVKASKSAAKKAPVKKPVAKKVQAKKPAAKKAPAKPLKKPAAKKPAVKKPEPKAKAKAPAKVAPKATVKKESKSESKVLKLKKPAAKTPDSAKSTKPVKPAKKPAVRSKEPEEEDEEEFIVPRPKGPIVITPFQKAQREKLQALRDLILDSMAGVAKDTLRSRPEGNDGSAFGMHQADAGSDAYDKDFALSLLSQEQDALYEIEEALKRIEAGTYGLCEMTGKPIMIARLEALPFARYTVECQAELERTKRHQRSRVPVTSLFGLTDSEEEDGDGEEAEEKEQKPQNEE